MSATRQPCPTVRVVYENACETCDAHGPEAPIVEIVSSEEEGRTYICADCAKIAVAVLQALGLTP